MADTEEGMSLYSISFFATLTATLLVQYVTRAAPDAKVQGLKTAAFKKFQLNYLVVYLLAFFADWLQGPYVYALYDYYGYDAYQIAVLFIMGFVSSMIVGTFAGSLADSYGRRLFCAVYAVSYIISCMTKFHNNFYTLLLGRFMGGLSTSLLFSVFEAWMVSEHQSQGFDEALLSDTFGLAYFGNGLVAIAAGVVAEGAAGSQGYVAPFGIAIIPLIIILGIIMKTWNENYGNQKIEFCSGFGNALKAVANDPKVALLGAAQSAFEGAMYTFVFMWTPAIATPETKASLPYGTIFAAFMVCCALGSSLFSFLMRKTTVETVPQIIHGVAAVANFGVVMFVEDKFIVYMMFLLFEVACGMFFPTYGTLRSKYIPEETRAAVMNLYRIPLNAFVILVLIKVKNLPVETVFTICAVAHAFSFVAYTLFLQKIK
eukprot:m.351343 g.351343  ORF g.351343 m.351343 type:complete len:430 (-) comp20698_c0_seq4:187-1476(-)